MEKSTSPLRIADIFPNVSALGELVGFELGFRQLDKGDPTVEATALVGKNVAATKMRFNCGFHQMGLPPAKMVTFGIPLVGLKNWFGREYRTSSILPFNHAGGIDGVSVQGFEAMTISTSADYLADVANTFRVSVPNWLLDPKPDFFIDRGKFTEHFRKLLNELLSDPAAELGQEFEDELVYTLLQASQNRRAQNDRSSYRQRARALDRALAYIADHQQEAITVRTMCSETLVPVRTLNRAFNERFGIGPKAYVNRSRLSAVREELLRSPPETKIIDIANRWGFWHLGQFARDYRALFGELPSQTAEK